LPEEQPLVATEEVPSAAQTLQVDAEGNLQPVEDAPGEIVVPEAVATPAAAPAVPAEVEEAAPQD
jgi:hypothetical protein